MTTAEPIIPAQSAEPAAPESLRLRRRPLTHYWDAADACWVVRADTAQIPAPRVGD